MIVEIDTNKLDDAEQRVMLCQLVACFVAEDPSIAGRIAEAMTRGAIGAYEAQKEHAMIAELALSAAIYKRFDNAEEFILEKVLSIAPRGFLKWDWAIEALEKKIEKKRGKDK